MTDMGPVISVVQTFADNAVDTAVAPLHEHIAELDAEVARLQAIIDAQEPEPAPLMVGAACNVPSGPSLVNFHTADQQIGPLTVRRSFPKLETIANQVKADKASGYDSFTSLKPPVTDAQYGALRLLSGYFTERHEPENDVTADEFTARLDHVYGAVKPTNPDLRVGPVYMTYWWKDLKAGVGKFSPSTRDSWLPDRFDFLGCDNYNIKPLPLDSDPQWLNWFGWALPIAKATGKPIYIVEYGAGAITPGMTDVARTAMEKRRAEVIAQDHAYLAQYREVRMWLYWNGTGAAGDWSLRDTASQRAWRDVAAAGRTA